MWAKVSLYLQRFLYTTSLTSTDHLISDVAGSIQTADVAATLVLRFVYRDRAESTGAIHDAPVGEGNVPYLRMYTLIDTVQSLRQEQRKQLSQRIKLELALPTRKQLPGMMRERSTRQPQVVPPTILFHMIHARENRQVFMHVEVAWGVSCVSALGYAHLQGICRTIYTTSTLDRCTDRHTELDTDLDINLGTNLGTDNGGAGEATVATVTIGPTIIDMIDITLHLLARDTGIDQHHLKRREQRITII